MFCNLSSSSTNLHKVKEEPKIIKKSLFSRQIQFATLQSKVLSHFQLNWFLFVATSRYQKLQTMCKDRKLSDWTVGIPASSACSAARRNCTIHVKAKVKNQFVTSFSKIYSLTLDFAGLLSCISKTLHRKIQT